MKARKLIGTIEIRNKHKDGGEVEGGLSTGNSRNKNERRMLKVNLKISFVPKFNQRIMMKRKLQLARLEWRGLVREGGGGGGEVVVPSMSRHMQLASVSPANNLTAIHFTTPTQQNDNV